MADDVDSDDALAEEWANMAEDGDDAGEEGEDSDALAAE